MRLDPISTTFLTGMVVVAGKWSSDEKLSIREGIGAGFLAIFLTFLDSIDRDLTRGISLLILLTAAFLYVPKITRGLGLTQ